MPITRHHTGRWLFQFNRVVPGAGRQRANRLLPAGWTRAQADAYDRAEVARLYAFAAGVGPRRQPLIEDAVLLYLEQHAPRLKNRRDIEGALALMHPWYAGRTFADLPDACRRFDAAHTKTLAPATVRNRIAYLRAACRWAWKVHKMGEHDPAERIVLPKVNNARTDHYGRADMLRIASQIRSNPDLIGHTAHRNRVATRASRSAYRVGFYTGMRVGEVLASQAVTIAGQLHLAMGDTKNGTPHLVPVHPRIAHLVRGSAWPPQVTKWTVSHHVKAAARAIGLGHLRLHDARHSAASEMINAGVDLHTVGRVLNHKSAASTARYAHLATASLRAAIGKIGKKVQPADRPKAA